MIRIRATGLMAEAFEYEIDHLNGILYIDHVEGEDRLHRFNREWPGAGKETIVVKCNRCSREVSMEDSYQSGRDFVEATVSSLKQRANELTERIEGLRGQGR